MPLAPGAADLQHRQCAGDLAQGNRASGAHRRRFLAIRQLGATRFAGAGAGTGFGFGSSFSMISRNALNAGDKGQRSLAKR